MEEEQAEVAVPHVLIFPLPLQGHVNSMLKLSELLCEAGFQVTFLNSHYNHDRLLSFTDVHSRFTSRFPRFRFQTISDGLPPQHPRSANFLKEMFDSINSVTKPLFRDLLISLRGDGVASSPVTCVIADGIMTFTIDIAEELGIPIIAFRTISACAIWAYFCLPKLVEAGELPFKDEDMDRPITCVPGMETLLRRRDLPSFCRVKDITDPVLHRVITETLNTSRASALILNTFEDLESHVLSHIRSHHYCSKLYTLGPLHALLTSLYKHSSTPISSNSLWQEDKTCMTWLDSHPSKSVLYVSFGSLAVVTRDELLEFWFGLVSSGKPFLWVIRPDSVTGQEGERQIPAEILESNCNCCIVEWAPQEEVLRHRAVGGFVTHSGWNSTLESIYEGVPMICWPYFADQQINSRFVSDVWRVGLDMKDVCDRRIVEKMVRSLMEEKREEFRKSATKFAEMGRVSVSKGGSSYSNLNNLINDIRLMSLRSVGR